MLRADLFSLRVMASALKTLIGRN